MRREWVLVMLIACGGSGAHVDGPVATDGPAAADASLAALTCNELRARASALVVTVGNHCGDVSSCTVFGAGLGSCNGEPALLPMGGVAVNAAAVAASADLQALQAEFQRRCASAPCSTTNSCEADVAPSLLECKGGTCTATPRSCLVPPPDAATCSPATTPCGGTTCNADEYCTLDFPGACPLGQPDASCPGWCGPCGLDLKGCSCPTAVCHPLPAGCHACDCIPAWSDCPAPTCFCGASGGFVQQCPRA
jgi:hypothetical protein